RPGAMVGMAGVAGNGQDELFAVLSGERRAPAATAIAIDGAAAGHLSITERRRLGAAFVPEERLGHATAPRFKLSDNALISGHAASGMTRYGFIQPAVTLAVVDKATKIFDVRQAQGAPGAASLAGRNLGEFV